MRLEVIAGRPPSVEAKEDVHLPGPRRRVADPVPALGAQHQVVAPVAVYVPDSHRVASRVVGILAVYTKAVDARELQGAQVHGGRPRVLPKDHEDLASRGGVVCASVAPDRSHHQVRHPIAVEVASADREARLVPRILAEHHKAIGAVQRVGGEVDRRGPGARLPEQHVQLVAAVVLGGAGGEVGPHDHVGVAVAVEVPRHDGEAELVARVLAVDDDPVGAVQRDGIEVKV
mmetsp:Transcript_23352/g.58559  ORF Transcript_23352/g.58559 Transcript_23352/m.58559 type:complete len:231 (-) Transcript_23352:400-1092(-)